MADRFAAVAGVRKRAIPRLEQMPDGTVIVYGCTSNDDGSITVPLAADNGDGTITIQGVDF